MTKKKGEEYQEALTRKTLPEAQRTQGIESITWVISAAKNIATDATSQAGCDG